MGNNVTEPSSQMGNMGGMMPSDNTRVCIECYYEQNSLDQFQLFLEGAGLAIPVADLINGAIYLARGRLGDASLSLIGIIPVVGDAANIGGKAVKSVLKVIPINSVENLISALSKVKKLRKGNIYQGEVVGNIDDIMNAITKNADNLGKGLYEFPDGTVIKKYISGDGIPTIRIERTGKRNYKIRVR